MPSPTAIPDIFSSLSRICARAVPAYATVTTPKATAIPYTRSFMGQPPVVFREHEKSFSVEAAGALRSKKFYALFERPVTFFVTKSIATKRNEIANQ